MSMVTQCPHCTTAFNVTPEQLFARDGRVRCGQCRQVFDGLVNLTSLEALEAGVPPPLAEPTDAELRAREEAADAAARPAPVQVAAHGFAPVSWPMVPNVPEVPTPVMSSQPHAQPEPGVQPAGIADSAASAETGRKTLAGEMAEAEAAAEAVAPRRQRRWPWAMAAALAALILCGQVLYAFRSEAAAYFPQTRPALAQLCVWARCTVPPLQRPSALTIQASDLLILDKAKPHLVQLIVTLQNLSNVEVAYPAIDLVLNDRFDHAVARRVFLPKEYLRGADAKKTVIAGSVATTVRIDLDLSDLSAGGFGLLLIPAPQT